MMDWYFGHDLGDLVVPKNQEYFDRLPSPDNWSPWDTISGLGNSGWPNNFDDAGKAVNLSDEKPNQRVSFGRSNKEINQSEAERSYGSSNLEGTSEDSPPWKSARRGCPDMQFNSMTQSDTMGDIFLSSLLDDDSSAAAHNQSSLALDPQSQCTETPADGNSTDRMFDFGSVSYDTAGLGSCKYLRNPPLSPSAGSNNGRSSVPNLSFGNDSDHSNGPSVKALETMDMLLSDQEAGGEDSSMEESVLLGLETVLSQLSDKTRLCFRDSLYRLAERSQPQMSKEGQVEAHPLGNPDQMETSDAQTRSTETVTAESETNTIDRAVANLMFCMVDGDLLDPAPTESPEFEHSGKASAAMQTCNYDLAQAETFLSSEPAKSIADSEVPVFSHKNSFPTQNQSNQLAEM